MDFQFDATADGRRLKFLNVIDEHSRLCLAIRVGRRCKARDVVAVLEELTSLYPAPAFIRCDNGPEFIAHALRRWCQGSGTTTATIEPGSDGDTRPDGGAPTRPRAVPVSAFGEWAAADLPPARSVAPTCDSQPSPPAAARGGPSAGPSGCAQRRSPSAGA
ncbi:transposase [Synechococcus sp. RSCCF101]|nr:transposase [Synechococcus sp. RSCCF101]